MKMNYFVLSLSVIFSSLVIFVSGPLSLKNNNLPFLLVPRGKFSYLLYSSMGRSKVRISHKAALLELVGIQCLAQGDFSRVEACQCGASMIVLQTSELTLHGQLHTPSEELWP